MKVESPTAPTMIFPLDVPRTVAWEQDALELFTSRMLDKFRPFPCVFGVDAVRKGTLRAAFVEDGDVDALAKALKSFTSVAESLGRRTSLVVFFGPESDGSSKTTSAYRDQFWQLLQRVHELDADPWPGDIPTDTEDPSFEFAFGGTPMFAVANTPAHKKRTSRYFEYFAITFQPRFVFDDISASSLQGQNARKVIRARLADYDDVPQTPLLGNFGETGNQEWKQYYLEDDNSAMPEQMKCPFHVTTEETDMDNHPKISTVEFPELPSELRDLLPHQGSFELQNDRPKKTHTWHQHSVDEELFILAGDVLLFWTDDRGRYQQHRCPEGTRIELPAGTSHGSTAGANGAVYVIRPKDGQAAITTFLEQSDHPFPVPALTTTTDG